jgi:acyl-homoserine lactone acylase PvdQ
VLSALFPEADPEYNIGSNSWAVAGSRTAGGAALVANPFCPWQGRPICA